VFSPNQGNAENIRKPLPLKIILFENVVVEEQRIYLPPSSTPFLACETGHLA